MKLLTLIFLVLLSSCLAQSEFDESSRQEASYRKGKEIIRLILENEGGRTTLAAFPLAIDASLAVDVIYYQGRFLLIDILGPIYAIDLGTACDQSGKTIESFISTHDGDKKLITAVSNDSRDCEIASFFASESGQNNSYNVAIINSEGQLLGFSPHMILDDFNLPNSPELFWLEDGELLLSKK